MLSGRRLSPALVSLLVAASLAYAADAPPADKAPGAAAPASPARAQGVAAPAAGSNASWLWADPKSDAWKSATARCRELLDKLDLQKPLAVKHLPRVRQNVQLLLRSPDFDWKKATALDYLANMLEDLIAGQEPYVRYRGKEFGYPYWSEALQRIEATWIHVPPDYDPAKTYQLFLYYKCGGGIYFKDGKAAGGYRPTAEIANRTDTFHAWSSLDVQVKGRLGAPIELEEFPAALAKDFAVDPDRVFLTGWSDGGFTAIWLASHYPHLVAGIAPDCGNWQYTNVENVGLLNVATLAVDGWSDGGYNNLQFPRWQVLRNMGADASSIWGQHGHSQQPYEDIEEFQYILDWAKARKRHLYPRRVRYATWNLHWNRAYWLSIDRVASPVLAAQVDAEVKDGGRIEVQAWNVAAYRLALSDKLVDPARPVTVVTNGKESYAGPFKPELGIELGPRPAGKFVKDAAMPDDITAAVVESSYNAKGLQSIPSRRWLLVRPTGWDAKTAQVLAKWPPTGAKADAEVSEDDLARFNLTIYGGPDINKLAARMAAELPVKFEKGKFTVGRKVYDQPSEGVAFIHPNPLAPKKYVILYAFNDAATFARHGFFEMTGESVWKFRSGDCVVSGIPAGRPRWGVALEGRPFDTRRMIFDAAWRADASAPLGELEKPFDYLQILRLKADAIREAAEADIGVIWAHTAGWNRWGERLAAGPVTLHGLATLDMLPENVMVAEMAGADLVRGKLDPAAWTVFADKREPGYDEKTCLAAGDIDPGKTYKVAMGYFGLPMYSAEPKQMPKLFQFATEDEFLAAKTNHIFLRHLRQLPVQVIEATAQHIQRHKKVSPRPMGFSLTEYIFNPQDNDFGACDWLHLGLDVSWKVSGGSPGAGRYTLNLGLRGAEEPAAAPPRRNARHFLDLGEEAGAPAAFDFAALQKKLPVTVGSKVSRFAITADTDGKSFALAPGEGGESAIGRAVLVEVRLTHKGQGDLAGVAVLSDTAMRRVYGDTWPDEKDANAYYAGYRQAVAKGREPPTHEDAVLILSAGAAPKASRLVAPGAGYNVGLVGLSMPITLKAGESLALPLLLVSVDRPPGGPEMSLAAVLASVRAELIKRFSPQ